MSPPFNCEGKRLRRSILFTFPSESPLFLLGSSNDSPLTRQRGRKLGELVVSNAHSNLKIINQKKISRYGQTLSPYDSDEEEEFDDDSDGVDDEWLLNDDFPEVTEYEKKKPKSQKQNIPKKDGKKESVKKWEKLDESETGEEDLDTNITRNVSRKKKKIEKDSWRSLSQRKILWYHTVFYLFPIVLFYLDFQIHVYTFESSLFGYVLLHADLVITRVETI